MKTCLSCLLLQFCLCSAQAKTRKAVYIVLDGIPADYIERVRPTHIFDIARQGGYARAYTGGEVGGYSQTPTISAIGYMNILTGTWMNKHRVNGNSNLKPNYNYWSIFRLAKAQKKPCKTALFSSWTDNRTVLIGAGKPETGNLAVDYVYDGYELDEARFPPRPDQLHIFSIDSVVSHQAAQCIRRDARERSVWISTNIRQLNRHFTHASLSLVDIQPTLSRFMGFEVPQEVAFERDGIAFFGPTDIYDLASHPYDHTVVLSWKSEKTSADATIYMATTNRFASGGTDEWKVVGKVKARSGRYVVDLSQYPSSKFYKFAVATPCNVLTRWVYK